MSFQITLAPHKRIAGRYVGSVRRLLQEAFGSRPDLSQADLAREIGVNRSVITRQLRGSADMSTARVAEIAAVLGFEPELVLHPIRADADQNAELISSVYAVEVSTSARFAEPRKNARHMVAI